MEKREVQSILDRYGIDKALDFSDGILKEHNEPVYSKIIQGFDKSNKVLVEQATGTGKTFLAMKYIKDFASNGERILFVAPTHVVERAFLDNCAEYLGYNSNNNNTTQNKRQTDTKVQSTPYNENQTNESQTVQSKHQEASQTDIQKEKQSTQNINISTALYASLNKVTKDKYDLIILDEVHRAGAPKWSEYAKKLIDNNPNARVLGLTATLERTDGVDIKPLFDNQQPVSSLTLVDAIKDGVLPTPDYTLSKIDFQTDLDFINENSHELMEMMKNATPRERAFIVHYLADLNAAQKMISEREEITDIFARELDTPKLKSGKFIVFCEPGEKESEQQTSLILEQMAKQAPEWFKSVDSVKGITTYLAHSRFGDEFNESQIEQFEQDKSDNIKLLFTVNMLNEGKHVKDIDGVIMFRPTSSRLIYLQQLGRALSVGNNEHPKIFDFVANLSYANIQEMTMLLSLDERTPRTANADAEGDTTTLNLKNLAFDLNIRNLELYDFLEKLHDNIYSFDRDYRFERFYNHLIEYKDEYGDVLVPSKYVSPDGYKLGRQVLIFRQIERGTSDYAPLTKEQKDKLNEIGFIWNAKKFDFEKFYNYLVEYKSEFGDVIVPKNYTTSDGYKLGSQVHTVRQIEKGTSRGTRLTLVQKARLDEIGFKWDATIRIDFEKFYNHLVEYKAEFGNLLVPTEYITDDGYKLGYRVQIVRYTEKGLGESAPLTQEQRDVLNNLGFVWDATVRFDFERFYNYLVEYKAEFGDVRVPVKYITPDGYTLGSKVGRVRLTERGITGGVPLTLEQKDKLNEIGFVWDAKNKFNFDEFYNYLVGYNAEFGDVLVPKKYVTNDGYKLGAKVLLVRQVEKGTTHGTPLSQEQKEKLDDLGFVWDAKNKFNFDEFYSYLVGYKAEFNDLLVPKNYETTDGYKLGQQVYYIRKTENEKSRGTILTNEQKSKLNELGFVWDATSKFDFEKFYNHLIEYNDEFGNLIVPSKYIAKDGYTLGKKVGVVRQIEKGTSRGTPLSQEQKGKLNKIGFVWDATVRFDFVSFHNHLIEYKAEFGNLVVPNKYIAKDGYPLGKRVKTVRQIEKGNQGGCIPLTQEQMEALNDIGFVWDATKKFDFEKFYNHLVEYKGEYGDLLVPFKYITPDGYALGNKVITIRRVEKGTSTGTPLTKEQKDKLDDLGFVWEVRNKSRETTFGDNQ